MVKPFHKFKQGGNYILLDINNGGVHAVDGQIYHALDRDDFAASPEYAELIDAGIFDSEDDYAEYADMNVNAPLKAMCLHVSHDCNLKCGYCFAESIIEHTVMSPETAKKAIDFLIRGSAGREHLEADFFGGEPLLAWETVTQTVEYAKAQGAKHGKKFRFTITTNGLLLDDEKTAYINEEMSNVVLSLDGRREVNDRLRKCKNGKGSYDIILPKFRELVDSRKKTGFTDYFIRGTFTGYNLDFADDVLAIANEGFRYISIEPVTVSTELPFAIKKEHIPRIKSEYDRLSDIMSDNNGGWSFFHFCADLEHGPCILKRLRGCGAGNEYIAVTPDGNIFPCHRYAGIDEWKMGNINIEASPVNKTIKEYFSKTHIYAKEKCRECWARFYCGGGCNAEFFIFEGDANKPSEVFCELMKKRTECAIALAVRKALG
ncbi:MAG: thioether cross-link-forming SCIFF peptide maturase [Oscillospiraceae bacterium]|jgi:uncharacterized protein|nr:thioether cross-link-forming SCIFF peptide maturase [Oscillospiraceae bacterium]